MGEEMKGEEADEPIGTLWGFSSYWKRDAKRKFHLSIVTEPVIRGDSAFQPRD